MIKETIVVDSVGGKVNITRFTKKTTGKCVIILHGMALYSGYYYNALDYLSDEFTDFFFIDMLNHGNSDGVKGVLPSKEMLYDVIDSVIKHIVGIKDINTVDAILAESMGGIIIMSYILDNPKSSLLKSKLILFSVPLYINYLKSANINALPSLFKSILDRNSLTIPIKEWNRPLIADDTLYSLIREDPLVPEYVSMSYLLTLLNLINHIDKNISKFKNDTLLLYGKNDALSKISRILKIAEESTNISAIVFPNQPHAIFWSVANDYKNIISTWIKGD